VTEFSRAQIDDARRLILAKCEEMVQAAPQSFYPSTTDAIRAAAFELVVERRLPFELAKAALPEALAFVARRRTAE
jgi:hypothetical protein